MIEINNNLEPMANMKREREGAPWTEEEIRLLIQHTEAGFDVETIAFDLKRSKTEVILQGLALNVLAVEPTADSFSEEAYRNIINAHNKLGTDEGKENFWNELSYVPRTLDKIQYMEKVFSDKIWYQYYLGMRYRVENGLETVAPEIWESALKEADTIAAKYGAENLGPYTEYEWGMLNGKLSAIRWIQGMEWDFLDL